MYANLTGEGVSCFTLTLTHFPVFSLSLF